MPSMSQSSVEILENADLASVCERGVSVTDADFCLCSNWFCNNYAYATEVRPYLQWLKNDGETDVVTEDLSERYLKRAGAFSEQQATHADWRCPKLFND